MKFVYLLFNLFFITGLVAQTYSLDSEPAEILSISGSSSLHDWTVIAGEMNNVLQELQLKEGKLFVDTFQLSIPVHSLNSGKPAMETKMHKALKGSDYPEVQFQLKEELMIDVMDEEADSISGILTVAGKSVPIDLDLSVSMENNVIILTGNEDMKMTDFDINPPTALFGQIKTHDEIVVNFELKYKQTIQ